MAHVSQEKKARIQTALRAVMPRDWKWSLAVRHHSTIVLTISRAPVDLVSKLTELRFTKEIREAMLRERHFGMNPYHWRDAVADRAIAETFDGIFDALNIDNFDRSDVTTDYFDVGHYVDVRIGRWNKPFEVRA